MRSSSGWLPAVSNTVDDYFQKQIVEAGETMEAGVTVWRQRDNREASKTVWSQARPCGGRRDSEDASETVWRQASPSGGRRDCAEASKTVQRQARQ